MCEKFKKLLIFFGMLFRQPRSIEQVILGRLSKWVYYAPKWLLQNALDTTRYLYAVLLYTYIANNRICVCYLKKKRHDHMHAVHSCLFCTSESTPVVQSVCVCSWQFMRYIAFDCFLIWYDSHTIVKIQPKRHISKPLVSGYNSLTCGDY